MSISVTFPERKEVEASKGTAGLKTRLGGICTTVSTLCRASGEKGIIKKSIG